MKDLTWKHVILFLGVFAILVSCATTLVVLDKDVSVILTLAAVIGVPILSAAGAAVYQQVSQMREQTNGNMGRMLSMLEAQLSASQEVVKMDSEMKRELAVHDHTS